MDYFGILQRSLAITGRHRVLWVFGFLLALFGAGSSSSSGFQYTFEGGDFSPGGTFISPEVGVVAVLVAIAFAFALAIIAVIVNYVSHTALIKLVGEIEEGDTPTARHGFDVGWSPRAVRLFGVDLAIFVPAFLVILALIFLLIVPLIFVASGSSGQGDAGPFVVLFLCCLFLLIPVAIAVAVILSVLKIFFYRQVVLADDGVFDSIRNGYRLVRANLGHVAAMWLVMFVIGLLWAAVNFVIGLVAFAFVGGPAALMYSIFRSGLAAVLGALPFLVLAVVLFAVINALYVVFTNTVWTLTYLELPNRLASDV